MKIRIYNTYENYIDIDVFDAKLQKTLNGADQITFTAESEEYFEFKLNGWISTDYGDYVVNQLPEYEKKGVVHSYKFKLEAKVFELRKVSYLDVQGNSEFFLSGTLDDYVDLIISNISRSGATVTVWDKGNIPENTAHKNIQFNTQNAWQVINTLCDEYDVEFNVELGAGKLLLSFYTKLGNETGISLEYGKGKGIQSLRRTNVNSDELITRLYYFGSEENLKYDYGYSRLRGTAGYIEQNIDQYGVHEGIKNFNEIKPEYIGNVSAYAYDSDYNEYLLTDTLFPVDLKAVNASGDTLYLIEGTSAKINFRTGNCAGYTFDVKDYDHDTHTFKLIPFDEENGYRVPNATIYPAAGDEYVIVDIYLPETYVSSAVDRLDAAALDYISLHSTPRVQYEFEADTKYFEQNDIYLQIGDQLTVNDADLDISATCRVIEITHPIFDKRRQKIKLSDVRFVIPARKPQMRLNLVERLVKNSKLDRVDKVLKNEKTTEELKNKTYDYKDNYFVPENNRPESLDPYMLALDSGEIQFSIKQGALIANYEGDPTSIHVNAGEVIHHSFRAKSRPEIDKIRESAAAPLLMSTPLKSTSTSETYDPTRTWSIAETTISAPTSGSGYFVYLKIPLEEGQTVAEIVLDENHIWAREHVVYDPVQKSLTGFILYKIGWLEPEDQGKRKMKTLWGDAGHDEITIADDGSQSILILDGQQLSIDLSGYVEFEDLHSVAFSGDYNELENKPDLSNYITDTDVSGTEDYLPKFGASGLTESVIYEDASGKVGIGTTLPSTKIEVYESINGNTGFTVRNDNTGVAAKSYLGIGNTPYSTPWDALFIEHYGTGYATNGLRMPNSSAIIGSGVHGMSIGTDRDASLSFFTNGINKGADVTIDSNGNVGIGKTTPSEKLEVNGNVKADFFNGVPLTDAGSGDLFLSNDGTYKPLAVPGTETLSGTSITVNWNGKTTASLTLTAATTINFGNRLNYVKRLFVTGDYELTLPSGCKMIYGYYDGAVVNVIDLIPQPDGTVWITINKES